VPKMNIETTRKFVIGLAPRGKIGCVKTFVSQT